MADTGSYSQSRIANNQLRNFLLPGWVMSLVYIIASFAALSAVNYAAIWQVINGGSDQPSEALFSNKMALLTGKVDSVVDGKFILFIVWGLIGCGAYMLVWFGLSFLVNIRNDIVASTYVHPKSYKGGYWSSVLSRKILLGTLLFTTLIFIYLTIAVILPALANNFKEAIIPFSVPQSIITIITATVSFAITLYLCALLARVSRYTWRSVIENF